MMGGQVLKREWMTDTDPPYRAHLELQYQTAPSFPRTRESSEIRRFVRSRSWIPTFVGMTVAGFGSSPAFAYRATNVQVIP